MSKPNTYTFVVKLLSDTEEHAEQVMGERLFHDEQYEDEDGVEFDYLFTSWKLTEVDNHQGEIR